MTLQYIRRRLENTNTQHAHTFGQSIEKMGYVGKRGVGGMGYAEKEEYAEDTGKKEKSAAESPMSYICHMGWGGALTACLADE